MSVGESKASLSGSENEELDELDALTYMRIVRFTLELLLSSSIVEYPLRV